MRRAVVIGSGFGGLAAAIRLARRGWQVQVLETLDAPGGRAYVWRQDGFSFDAGPTIITAPHLLEELWSLCGRRLSDDVQLKAMEPFYRIRFHDGSWFDYSGDEAAMRREIARFSPEDLPGYERFVKEAQRCYDEGFIGLGGVVFDSVGDLLSAIPSMVKMRAWQSIYTMVCRHLKNPKLRMVMSFHPLLIGGNPFSVTCVYSLINTLERKGGVHWAMGGTGAIITAMVALLERLGGQLRCNAEVRRIEVTEGRATGVTLADGSRVDADIVVSNADTAWTYRHLLPAQARSRWTDRRIERARYSMGLFVWYFGTRVQYPQVAHHTILLGPRYRQLLGDIFTRKRLAEDFSLYLHRPTATDPSLAPPGCDAFYVLSPVPNLDSGTDWGRAAEPYRQRIAQYLESTVLPGLGEAVVSSRLLTPQDFQDRLCSYRGAAFGFEPTLLQSGWVRPTNKSEDIEHLYLVGAGTHPGAGLPGVLSSARVLDKVVPDAVAFV
jgi:phytoene desaturase